jgi:hypothetical protein
MKASYFARATQHVDMGLAAQKLLSDVTDYLALVETEKTKRLEIQSKYQVDIAKIEALKSSLETFLNRSFEERRYNFEQLFDAVRTSMNKSDMKSLEMSLSAVVELAKASPLAEVQSLSSLRSAMADPDHEFRL